MVQNVLEHFFLFHFTYLRKVCQASKWKEVLRVKRRKKFHAMANVLHYVSCQETVTYCINTHTRKIMNAPKTRHLFGSASIFGPKVLHAILPTCAIPSLRTCAARISVDRESQQMTKGKIVGREMFTQLTTVAWAGVGLKPAANKTDYDRPMSSLGSHLFAIVTEAWHFNHLCR